MIGYALEHGPYVFEDGDWNMTENPYAWNNNATIIYLDAPAGTGYSICGDAKECIFDDSNSADDNLEALMTLLRDKFTALQNNPLWLGGETYAGVYVPQLMQKLDALIA
jgi:carboxypeptidase C (cathepsin A)